MKEWEIEAIDIGIQVNLVGLRVRLQDLRTGDVQPSRTLRWYRSHPGRRKRGWIRRCSFSPHAWMTVIHTVICCLVESPL